jgi:aryl-alcohol dehydrogenase-like predicted oxidoreductase
MQDHYNLLAREEEREMLPLCIDEGVGTIPWSPLARGRLTRPPGEKTQRSSTDGDFADLLYTQADSDRAIVEALGEIAEDHAVSRAQVALAWLHSKPVVTAPIVGSTKAGHLVDAVASLDFDLTSDEISRLEAPYTPRYDFQGVSDPAVLAAISERVGIKPAA